MNVKAALMGSVQRLAHTNRYSTYHVNRRENVAEHTCFVALYCYMIGGYVESADPDVVLDWKKLLSTALVHDLDEALTGDFLRSVKYKTPGLKEKLDVASKATIFHMSNELRCYGLENLWLAAKDESTEGSILKIADFMSVASYVIGETHSGNKHLVHVFAELKEYLQTLHGELRAMTVCPSKTVSALGRIVSDMYDVITDVSKPDSVPFNSEYK